MANVELNEYLEDSDLILEVKVDFDCEHSGQAYQLLFIESGEQWIYGKELDQMIRLLQKAKRILKTRIIKEGD